MILIWKVIQNKQVPKNHQFNLKESSSNARSKLLVALVINKMQVILPVSHAIIVSHGITLPLDNTCDILVLGIVFQIV